MHILQVDLENVKSYDHASVPFTLGTNAICGHNGAGKSTVLEAIGFALFDYLAVSQADFVREGEKSATVTVHVADRDGRAYQVVRRCGGSSQYYVYDPELGQKLTEGKQETMTWLYALMGMDGSGGLDVLFRDAVGVPQGLLTAAFLETPSRRKDIFNPLLRVDEYERVWEGLREPGRRLERLITDLQTRIAGLEVQVLALPDLRERAATLEDEIAQGEAQQTEFDQLETEATADLAVLAERKDRLDALDHALTEAASARQGLEVRLEAAEAALQAARTAKSVVAATRAAHKAYLDAQAQQEALETDRQARDDLRGDRQRIERALAVAEERANQLATDLKSIEAAKATMAALEDRVAEQRSLEERLQAVQRDADRLTTAEETLPHEQSRLAELQERHAMTEAKAETRATKVQKLGAARQTLVELSEERDRVTKAVTGVEAEQARVTQQVIEAEQRRRDAASDLAADRERLSAIEAQLDAVRRQLDELAEVEAAIETTRDAIAALADRRQQAVEAAATCDATLDQVRRQIEILSTAEAPVCPVCGEPLTPAHRAELITENERRLKGLEAERSEAQASVAEATTALAEQEQALSELEARARALPRAEEAESLAQQQVERAAAVERQAAQITQAEARLEAAQTALSAAKAQLAELQPELEMIAQQVTEQQDIIQQLESVIQDLPNAGTVNALAQEVAQQKERVADIEARIADLSEAPRSVQSLTESLTALDNPRRQFDRAADTASREPEVIEQHAAVEAEMAQLKEERTEVVAQLEAHADLDDRMTHVRETLTAHVADHQRYLQHEREAAALAEREATVDDLTGALSEATTKQAEIAAAREETAASYDAALHTRLTDELSELRAEAAVLGERLRNQRAQLEEATSTIATLETVAKELAEARATLGSHEATLSLLNHLRQLLRAAGPEVTRALVQMISLHADRLYAEIMQNYRSHLRWTEDYDIVLTTEGRPRTFQQLSGGEQMAAGLAVRLALLREISTIDVAFFDEPTANLDSERRTNLAQQILNIKGFSQLFVISHDDTFEQDTDHVIRVWKEDGASVVGEGTG